MSIVLAKGQEISLGKEVGGPLSRVLMGLGWDAKELKGFLGFFGGHQEIDLDASCILFDEAGKMIDAVWFRQLQSRDGSIRHSGDNRTGEGEGDDERILVDLPSVPEHVKTLVFVVNSFTGENFSQIENAFCRLVDAQTGREIARHDLSCQGAHNAQIIARLYRHEGEWKMHAIGENARGLTFQELLPAIRAYL